jgi:uncharacterized membrane protein YdjX (TVP38/TMEM64 family)
MANTLKTRMRAAVKAGLLVALIIAGICLLRFTPARTFLTQDRLAQLLENAGLWAPLIFVMIFAAGVCLFVPGTLLIALGAGLFGTYRGFAYVWLGAMLGAAASFWIGRTLGREFARSLIGNRLKKYDEAIERNGFATVLYLRLIYFPFTPLNLGLGLTRIRFFDYLLGTGLGIVVGVFIFTFFFGTIKEVWAGGNWGQLISFNVFFSVGLFVFSFFIPVLIKKARKET